MGKSLVSCFFLRHSVFSVTVDVNLCDWLQKTAMKNDFTLNTFSYMYKYMKLSTQNYLRNLSGTRNQKDFVESEMLPIFVDTLHH